MLLTCDQTCIVLLWRRDSKALRHIAWNSKGIRVFCYFCVIFEWCRWLTRCMFRKTKNKTKQTWTNYIVQNWSSFNISILTRSQAYQWQNIAEYKIHQDPRMNKVSTNQTLVIPIWVWCILTHGMKAPYLYTGGSSYNVLKFLFWTMCNWNKIALNSRHLFYLTDIVKPANSQYIPTKMQCFVNVIIEWD